MSTQTSSAESPSIRRFVRHYLEMVVAMMLGMAILGLPAVGALELFGSSLGELEASAPAVYLVGMAVTMTIPMVAWMRYRGHGWRSSLEMAGAMFVPAFATVVLLATALVSDFGALLAIEHIAMFPLMLLVMVLRWQEFALPHPPHATLGSDPHAARA
jgi:hypothetical protein